MSKSVQIVNFSESDIVDKIYIIRGQRVMLDRDLAEMYDVATSRLNEAVRRNISRFPGDFMFQLSEEEFKFLISQIAISKKEGRGGTRTSICFHRTGRCYALIRTSFRKSYTGKRSNYSRLHKNETTPA